VNYYAHGCRFVDRPWFLAGTAVPDWLAVSDRACRMRERFVAPFADGSGTPLAELAAGILQHLRDDDWFHTTPAFLAASAEVARMFRAVPGVDDGNRPAFLGHVAVELLLDRALMARDEGRLRAYYAVLDQLPADQIETLVVQMARHPPTRLAWFVTVFRDERFLYDYFDSSRLLARLNLVLHRVKLAPLPPAACAVLEAARERVDAVADELLPAPLRSWLARSHA
jgi:hypothetical protein